MAEVISINVKRRLTPDQRRHYHNEAARWAIEVERLEAELEHAHRQRRSALKALGMINTPGSE